MSNIEPQPILKRYPKAICHLHHALHYAKENPRLGLILGSGISEELHLPNWKNLLKELETKLDYPNEETVPQSYRAEQLFQYFRAKRSLELGWSDRDALEAAVGVEWCDFVSRSLYQHYFKNDEPDLDLYRSKISEHPYLKDLAAVASVGSSLVVTHNFDDALECALDLDPTAAKKEANRRYNTFWKPQPFLRRSVVNIYHPNGYKPFDTTSKGSEQIILTEGNFADHLANTNSAEAHFLLRHLADRTCLIIGHSLSDATLKNALRLHATQRPGHVNYYVHWHKDGEAGISKAKQNAIREANFSTYNLVTVFASSNEIGEILRLMNLDAPDLSWQLEGMGLKSKYVYYISGPVSSGKSTILGHLRDLATVEEWPGKMPREMGKRSKLLNKKEQVHIDQKLEPAIWKKNSEVEETKVGIVAVDRAPLDYLAFPSANGESISEIAKKRTSAVLPKFTAAKFNNMSPGHVIVISNAADVLFERQIQRGRVDLQNESENAKYIADLSDQQNRMLEVYTKGSGTAAVVKADPCSIVNTVKDVARVIHLDDYHHFPFRARLKEIGGRNGKNAT